MKKGFLAGIILGIICVFSIAYATGYAVGNAAGIRCAEYNDTSIFFNGEEIDLGDRRLISVIPEGEAYITNYMPVRAVLESLGYGVAWERPVGDNLYGRISVFTEEYLINSDEWVDYEELLRRLTLYNPTDNYMDLTSYFIYEEASRQVRFLFATPRPSRLYIQTAVIHDTKNDEQRIYVRKSEVDHYLSNILGIPGFDALTDDVHERLEEFLKDVVWWSEVLERIGAIGFSFGGVGRFPQPSIVLDYGDDPEMIYELLLDFPFDRNGGLQIAFNFDYRIFLIYYNNEFQSEIPVAEFSHGWGAYMRIEDINYYLEKFGFPKID